MRVAAIQMNSSAELGANLAEAERLFDQAAEAGARVAVLPENFCLMPADDAGRLLAAEREGHGPIQEFLGRCARERNLWLIGGTIPLKSERMDRVYSSTLVFDNGGVQVARYDKIHLFDVELANGEAYRESESIAEGALGDNLRCVDTPAGRIGLAVCYDLRFPEMFRLLGQQGAELFSLPSAFTVTTGRAHWTSLLRARAIENLAYVIAPGQWGEHANGRATYGHSLIVDPWGEVVAELATGVGVVTAEIDLERMTTLRHGFPALAHRRLQ